MLGIAKIENTKNERRCKDNTRNNHSYYCPPKCLAMLLTLERHLRSFTIYVLSPTFAWANSGLGIISYLLRCYQFFITPEILIISVYPFRFNNFKACLSSKFTTFVHCISTIPAKIHTTDTPILGKGNKSFCIHSHIVALNINVSQTTGG